MACLIEAQGLTAVSGRQRTADTEQDGHDPAHAVITRFQEPGQQADNQADKDGSDNSHGISLWLNGNAQSLVRLWHPAMRERRPLNGSAAAT